MSEDLEPQIILPPRASEDDPLDHMLVEITKAIEDFNGEIGGYGLGGAHGYGADWNSDVFQMHRYCWCERGDCPWCAGCFCDDNDWRDGPKAPPGTKCGWCAGVHRFAEQGALRPDDEPHYGAPHFWHKASGFRVWWYKWIGRDMQTVNLPADLTPIFRDCLADIALAAATGTAKTAKQAECEASQSGPNEGEGDAQ